MRRLPLLTLILTFTVVNGLCQVTPGGGGPPGGGGAPVPIGGIEILVAAGALIGSRKLIQKRTSKR